MSMPWFHVPCLPVPGEVIALDRDEAKHAMGVRRLGEGDGVTVFDGAGGVAQAAITGDRDRDGNPLVRVTAAERRTRPGRDVVVGVAPPKGDRLSTMLDMLGQLGVTAVVPLETRHGVVDAAGINRARAERILLESCKQSRCAWIPELRPAMVVEAFVRAAVADGRTALLAHPGGEPMPTARASRTAVAVGPEGGFAQPELDAARAAGAEFVDLGPTILRVEAAAVAMAAALRLPG